jgi:UDP-N-acetylglucosamine 2-epimerase (non-hydrolysing)
MIPSGRSLHVFIGTKAQLIKMAPIMQELDARGIPYRFISTGQHAASIAPLLEQFRLRDPDITLRAEKHNISTFREGLTWLSGLLWQAVACPKQVRHRVFGDQGGLCLIHGDTLTTLASLAMAKRAGLAVAHVEAGYRSFNLFDPFPEELVRLVAMYFSDLLFAPTRKALDNLTAMRIRGSTFLVDGNTIEDAISYAQRHSPARDPAETKGRYVVMSIHRFETLRSRKRLAQVVELAHKIAAQHPLRFIMHGPTRHYLGRYDLLSSLESAERIEVLPLQPYLVFVTMLSNAVFIVTDGGSIQEEAHVLGVPCMILRTRTERGHGLGENACLVGFDWERIDAFLHTFEAYRRPTAGHEGADTPSARLVDETLRWMSARAGAG